MKFSSLFRVAVVASALWLAAGTASALTLVISPTTGLGVFGNTVSSLSGQTFSDTFDFIMPSTATGGSASVVNIWGKGINFTKFALMQGSNTIASGFGSELVTLKDFKFEAGLNPYSLVVQGITIAAAAAGEAGYGGAIRVSPVPEPQTYAMLLVGLGLLGFTARSRKSNNFV